MRFANVIHALYEEPWLITATFHKRLCEIFDAHVTGLAHAEGGCAMLFDEEETDDFEVEVKDGIAFIQVNGVIGRRVGSLEKSSGVTDILDISKSVVEADLREDVKGIFLDIDSPGGGVTGVPEFGRMLSDVEKPVVAYTDGLMASAGYWIASGADAIFASPSSVVGSIGVYMAVLDSSRAYELEGYKQNLIATGKYKGAGVPGVPVTEEQLANFQKGVDEVMQWFVAAVTMHRDVSADSMQGQTFHAKEAQERGLIDGVSSREDAVQELRELIAMINE